MRRFSPALLVSGTLALAALFLYANPSFGADERAWPWEVFQSADPQQATSLALWALAGLWALVSSLGIAPRGRSLLTVALTGALLLLWGEARSGSFDPAVASLPLYIVLAMIALGAGLVLLGHTARTGLARALAFGGGIALIWHFAFDFSGEAVLLQTMVDDVGAWIRGDSGGAAGVWNRLLPDWALVVAGLLGVLVGLGAGGRALTWSGVILLVVVFAMPTVADLVGRMAGDDFWDEGGVHLATAGRDILARGGLAFWLLGTYGLADLAWNRRATA